MTLDRQRQAVRRYFTPPARWPYGCLAAGTMLPLTGDASALAAGASLVAVGVGALFVHKRRSVSDAAYDRARDALLTGLVATLARDLWRLDMRATDGAPRWVHVCAPSAAPEGIEASRRGRDGMIRFNPIRLMAVGFGEHRLHAWSGELDLLTGRMVADRAIESPYDAVTGVSTYRGPCRMACRGTPHELDDVETIVLAAGKRDALAMPLRSPTWARLLGGGELPTLQSDAAISRIRTVVRQRRRAWAQDEASPDWSCHPRVPGACSPPSRARPLEQADSGAISGLRSLPFHCGGDVARQP